ncbi:stage III sporulation protein AF [Ectobacillus panaciterrae]|uniref:stage III sporulation protein AF n=1 Tax=Ectobacillus panaciterrae TaxID=363872 RepID=UPI000425C96C|nr:stage III sporulation protein AF [Ectobacillus panaciterrae]
MQFITEWVRNIIVFLLLATVLHMLLPNSKLQKYVKFIVSLLLIVLILTPIFKLLQTDIQEAISGFDQRKYVADGRVENLIDAKKKEIQASQRAYILEQMAVQMKNQVAKELESQYGVKFVDLHLTVPEDKQEIKSQQDIQGIVVTLAKTEQKKSETVEAVKKVEINTSTPYEANMDTQASKDIQQFLAQQWQLEEKKITVEEGGRGRTHERQQK